MSEKEVRDMISSKVREDTGRRVKSVFYITRSIDGEDLYGVVGNDNKLFALTIVYNKTFDLIY